MALREVGASVMLGGDHYVVVVVEALDSSPEMHAIGFVFLSESEHCQLELDQVAC